MGFDRQTALGSVNLSVTATSMDAILILGMVKRVDKITLVNY